MPSAGLAIGVTQLGWGSGRATAACCKWSLDDTAAEVKCSENHRSSLGIVTDRQTVIGIVLERIRKMRLKLAEIVNG